MPPAAPAIINFSNPSSGDGPDGRNCRFVNSNAKDQ